MPTTAMGFTTVSSSARSVSVLERFYFSMLTFDLKFVSTASLQKISDWRQCSDWKTTLSLCTVKRHQSGTATVGLQGKMGHILLVILAFAPALCFGSSHLHVVMSPAPVTWINTPCNTTEELLCAWWKCDMMQSSFIQCSLRWISSVVDPPWYESKKKSYPSRSEVEQWAPWGMYPCYEQRYACELQSVYQASSHFDWHELSCSSKLQLSHARGIPCLGRAGHGLSVRGQSCNMLWYPCLPMNMSLGNIIASKRIKLWKSCRCSQTPVEPVGWRIYDGCEDLWCKWSREQSLRLLNGQGMHISGGCLGQHLARDRDLRFAPPIAPTNSPTERCELAELDCGCRLQ